MQFSPTRVLALVVLLESGAFRQTKGRLKREDKKNGTRHCCLGVGCELYSTEVGGGWQNGPGYKGFEAFEPFSRVPENKRKDDYDNEDDVKDTNSSLMPKPVGRWFGLSEDAQSQLAEMNDNGYGFALIARYLREQVAEYRRTKHYPAFDEPKFDKFGKDKE
jgi:hypothetical protein